MFFISSSIFAIALLLLSSHMGKPKAAADPFLHGPAAISRHHEAICRLCVQILRFAQDDNAVKPSSQRSEGSVRNAAE
jgi:hypothetical protein